MDKQSQSKKPQTISSSEEHGLCCCVYYAIIPPFPLPKTKGSLGYYSKMNKPKAITNIARKKNKHHSPAPISIPIVFPSSSSKRGKKTGRNSARNQVRCSRKRPKRLILPKETNNASPPISPSHPEKVLTRNTRKEEIGQGKREQMNVPRIVLDTSISRKGISSFSSLNHQKHLFIMFHLYSPQPRKAKTRSRSKDPKNHSQPKKHCFCSKLQKEQKPGGPAIPPTNQKKALNQAISNSSLSSPSGIADTNARRTKANQALFASRR